VVKSMLMMGFSTGPQTPDAYVKYINTVVVAVFAPKFDVFSLGITVAALIKQQPAQWAAVPEGTKAAIKQWIYWATCADVNARLTAEAARAAWVALWT